MDLPRYFVAQRQRLNDDYTRLVNENRTDADTVAQLQARIASRTEALHGIRGAFEQLGLLEQQAANEDLAERQAAKAREDAEALQTQRDLAPLELVKG